MRNFKHNEPLYQLHFSEQKESIVSEKEEETQSESRDIDEQDIVHVLSFEGEESISRLFIYRFELLSVYEKLDTSAILNKKATFILNRGEDKPIKIHGVISRFEQRGRTPDYVSYYAELVPKMWRLRLTHQSKIFQNMDIELIVTKVLESYDFTSEDYEFKWDETETYPEMEFVTQYRESDFNFVNRRLEHFGIFYFLEHTDDNDVIIFTDANGKLSEIDYGDDNDENSITYNPNKDPISDRETIDEFICHEQVVTGDTTKLKDYNYYHDEGDDKYKPKQIIHEEEHNLGYPGTYYEYGAHFKNIEEAKFLTDVRKKEIICNSTIFKGKSDCRSFHAGFKFKMAKHFRDDWNAEFILTKVISRGTQRGLFGILHRSRRFKPTYENYFEAIPVETPFRPPRITPQPKIYGFMNANIEGKNDGSEAEIDVQGRYKVRLPFDLSGEPAFEASHFIRMAQNYAGPDYGTHFPLHKDTEVLLTFMDGDPDRPVISGAVPNPDTISPVTSNNPMQCIIKDNAGNKILLDATPDKEHIYLHSPKEDSWIKIGDGGVTTSNKSEYVEFQIGNKYEFGLGSSIGINVGSELEAKVGTSTEIGFSQDFELFVGGKHEFGFGHKFEADLASKKELSMMDKSDDSYKDYVIKAGDGLCMIGGDRENDPDKQNSIINADGNQLVLSYGTIPSGAENMKWDPGPRVTFGLSLGVSVVFGALLLAFGEVRKWAFSEEPSIGEKSIWMGSCGSITVLFNIIWAIIVRQWFIKDDKIEPIYHQNEGAVNKKDLKWFSLSDDGILLGINPETKNKNVMKHVKPLFKKAKLQQEQTTEVEFDSNMDSKISLSKDGTINISSKGDGKTIDLKVGEEGNEDSKISMKDNCITLGSGTSIIDIEKDGDIGIATDNKNIVLIPGTGNVDIKGSKVKIVGSEFSDSQVKILKNLSVMG